MKVLFVTHYTNLHGANRSLLDLLEGLEPHGVKPLVLSPSRGPVTREFKKRKVPYLVLPFRPWLCRSKKGRISRLLINLLALPPLWLVAVFWGAELIYTNSSVTPVGAYLAFFLRKPHVWHVREFGELDYAQHPDWGRKCFVRWLNRAAAVIAVSDSLKKIALEGVRAKSYRIYNGVLSRKRLELLRSETSSASPGKNFTFAFIGQINKNKNPLEAIQAMALVAAQAPRARLRIAGKDAGDYADGLKKFCRDQGIDDKVEFLGYVDDPFEALVKSDAVLVCSKHEAMGRVTAEAMMAAKPVIGFDNAGTSELVEHEMTGLCYRGGHRELADSMKRMLENPDWAHRLGLQGRRKAESLFTIENYAAQVFAVLDGIWRR